MRILPSFSLDEIVSPNGNETLKIRIAATPVEGKANLRLIRFLAKSVGVPQDKIALDSGINRHNKRLAIHSPRLLPPVVAITPPKSSANK